MYPPRPDCTTCPDGWCISGVCLVESCSLSLASGTGCPGGSVDLEFTGNCSPNCGQVNWSITSASTMVVPAPASGSFTCPAGSSTITVTIDPDAPPEPVTLTLTGTTTRGGQCNSQATVTVEECVDLDFGGVPDNNETDPGGFLCLNDDDDNGNGVPDKDEPGATAGENDLIALTVSLDPSLTGTVTLSAIAGATRIKLYENADRSNPVTLPKSWTVPTPDLPETLYVEGFSVSLAARDIELKVLFTGSGGPCEDIVKLTVVRLDFISDANNVIPKAGQDAHLDLSNEKTDVNLPNTATFNGPPTTDPDNFRAEVEGLDTGLTPKIKITVTSGGATTYTHTFDMVEGAGPVKYRVDEHARLVSNDTDDAHLAHQTPKVKIGDDVKAELILGGNTLCEAELPVCRPFDENHRHAIRTTRNYFVEVDIPGTMVAANSDVPTTDGRMDEAWAQCYVRFDSTTRERAPVSNVLRITGISTAAGGSVNVTVDGVAVGPIAIANNRKASEVAQDIAAAINAAIPAAGAEGFNTFPPLNVAHMVAKKGNNVAYTSLAETVPGIAISVPALNFLNGIEFNDEEPALAANYGDGDANTIDFFIVDTLTTGNRGDAWPICHSSIGNTSDLRHTSYIVLSTADAAGDNPHTAAHEAGRFIMDFCGLHPGNFNLMNGTSGNDSIAARKRLEDAQCMTAFNTSNGTLLRQE